MPKVTLTAKERKAGVDLRDVLRPLTRADAGVPKRVLTKSERARAINKARSVVRVPKGMKKYEVTIIREIEHRAVIEVEAESIDVAKQLAVTVADNGNPYSNRWVEGDVISETYKVKVIS